MRLDTSPKTLPTRGLEVYMINIGLELFTFDPQVEEQEWPVTPYQIKVYTLPHCPLSFFSVYVDGVKVGKKVLKHGKDW